MENETAPEPAGAADAPNAVDLITVDPITVDPITVDQGDGLDRDRLLDLADRLERDVALVEGAMNDIESGDQLGVDAALAALGGH